MGRGGWRHGHEERWPGLLADGAVVDRLAGAAASAQVSISPCKRGIPLHPLYPLGSPIPIGRLTPAQRTGIDIAHLL